MRRVFAICGSALFFVLAPVTVAGLVPWWINQRRLESFAFARLPLAIAGVLLVVAGSLALLDSFARFALQGRGTPAPVFPTRHLIVSGLYRYVRNPMYVAVVAVILGQGLICGNVLVLRYGVLIWVCFHLFVLVYEERVLRSTFGPDYEHFRAAVPRWIPRLTAWRSHPYTE